MIKSKTQWLVRYDGPSVVWKLRHETTQAKFAIVQGGLEVDLRVQCARELASMDFHGYAVGGLSVGEEPSEMYRHHGRPRLRSFRSTSRDI